MPPLMLLLVKVFLGTALAGSAWWLAWYWRRGWHNPLGRVLIIDRLLIIALLGLSALSIYAGFNRLDSMVAAWIQIGLLALIGPVMLWMLAVVRRVSRATRTCPNGHVVSVIARFCPRCGVAVPEAERRAD